MPHRHRSSLVNPQLGVYFSIFAAGLAGTVVLLLIFEQLGVTEPTLRMAMALVSMGLFATVGVGAYTSQCPEFLHAGRRVPAFFNGLGLAIAAFGGAGVAGLAGALFLTGFDVFSIGLGIVAGLTVMVMTLAPFLRKFGAPTLPGFLGQRFESGPVRLLAASIAAVPLMLLVIAEIKIAIIMAGWLMPFGEAALASIIVLALVCTVAPGGVRSQSWSSAAQAMALLIALLVPAGIASVMETNLPFAQLTHGPSLRDVGLAEAAKGTPVPIVKALTLELPRQGLQAIAGQYAKPFSNIGPLAFVFLMLSVLAGIAGSPTLLARTVTTPSVYATRKSVGWAVILVGTILTTFSAIAVFERDFLMTEIVGRASAALPAVLTRLTDLGLAQIDVSHATLSATDIRFERDGVLIALPTLMGLPHVVANLVTAGILAAALAAAAASLTQLGLIIGEDVINAPASWNASDLQRLMSCRIALTVAAIAGGVAALTATGDPLSLMLHALAISGSALFPVVVLAIWWKRTTSIGAFAGLLAGFVTALAVILTSGMGGFSLPAALAPVAGIPVALAAAIAISQLTPAPGRHILEMVRDLRIPGGETIYDRETRQALHSASQRGPAGNTRPPRM